MFISFLLTNLCWALKVWNFYVIESFFKSFVTEIFKSVFDIQSLQAVAL